MPSSSDNKVENKIAPESEQSIKPSPLVKKISPGVYQIGKITIKQQTREISFPAYTNITDPDSILEFLLVHKDGEKVHESLLITEADPQHLNIALKLLRYQESKELFRVPKENGTPSDKYYEVPEAAQKAARLGIYLTTKHQGKEQTFPASNWVYHRKLKKEMPHEAWVYHGSYIHEQKFKAKLTGNFIAIFTDYGSLANYPGEGREDDTLWFPHPKTAKQGTQVTITIKPWEN